MKIRRLTWPLLGALLWQGSATANCISLDSGNQSPFAAIHLQPGTLSHSGCENSAKLRYSASNNFVLRSEGNEDLLIDGEVSRLELGFQLKTESLRWLDGISVAIPYYRHNEGSMDSLIDGWHDLTGLPEGDRPKRPNDAFEYRYVRNGQTLVAITEPQSGVGDAVVAFHKDRFSLAAKLPTGDEQKLTGSGGAEVALAYRKPLPEAGFSGFGSSVGATYIFDDKVLSQQSRSSTASAAIMAAVAIANRSNLFITANWQTAWYDSDIDALGSLSGNIGIGAYGELASGYWSVRITEDWPTETAPDFGLAFDYSWKL